MKILSALVFSLCCTAAVFAAPDAAQIYRNTTRYVDFDGETLMYYNTAEFFSLFNTLPNRIGKIMTAMDADAKMVSTVSSAMEIILKSCNLNAIKATAHSQKQFAKTLYLSKSVAYTGKNGVVPGCFDTSKNLNTYKLNDVLAELPFDTVAALKFQYFPGELNDAFEKNLEQCSNAEVKNFFAQARAKAQKDGIAIDKLLASANGNWTIFFAGYSPESFRVTITIPDNDGSITAVLKKHLPPAPQTPDRSFLPPLQQSKMKPAILYLGKQIMIVSDFDRCTKIVRPFSIPPYFANKLPADAASFSFLKISPELIDNLRQMKDIPPEVKPLLDALYPCQAVDAAVVESDGLRSVGVANFSINDLVINLLTTLKNIKR